MLDFINNNSQPSNAGDKSGGGSKGNPGGGRTSRDMVTWMSLFQSVKTFVGKEIDAVQKLEDKGSTTTGTKKKVPICGRKVAFNHFTGLSMGRVCCSFVVWHFFCKQNIILSQELNKIGDVA